MRGLYPEERVAFTHPLHAELPEDSRPVFYTRYLSAREQIRRKQLWDALLAAEQAQDQEARLTAYRNLLDLTVVGWDRITDPAGEPLAYTGSADALIDLLAFEDLARLLFAAVAATTPIAEDEPGKSDSPSPSNSAPSAATADAGPHRPGPASTDPTPPARP